MASSMGSNSASIEKNYSEDTYDVSFSNRIYLCRKSFLFLFYSQFKYVMNFPNMIVYLSLIYEKQRATIPMMMEWLSLLLTKGMLRCRCEVTLVQVDFLMGM